MTREVLNFLAKFKKLQNPMLLKIQAGILKLPRECVLGICVFPGADQTGKPVEGFWIERKNLSNFARSRFAAIGDDISAHGRAKLSVAFVDILNCAFALIAAGKIEVNVRPLTPFLGEKTFE